MLVGYRYGDLVSADKSGKRRININRLDKVVAVREAP
jgi:hypothetical protein